jgi:hypothetical protein
VFSLATSRFVEGRVITVPDDAHTVQDGLDTVDDGDTLFIRTGIYLEVLVSPPLRFAMIGEFLPDSDATARPIIDATDLEAPDSTPVLRLPSDSRAVIDNLHFKNQERAGIVCMGSEVSHEQLRCGFSLHRVCVCAR